jgi:hypothetical protein
MKKDILFICVLGIIFSVSIQLRTPNSHVSDFLAYWSASHLLITGSSPYDHTALSALEQSINPDLASQGEAFLNTWNPPWLILIFTPFGLMPYKIAELVWTFFNTVLIGLALIISWQMSSKASSSRGILYVFLACYIFGETISYLVIGQITSLVLIGMVLSIFLIDHHLDLLAGFALLLSTIKPQVSYFFLIIMLIWIIQNRRWQIIEGLAIAASSTLIIFWIVNPGWVTDYIILIKSMPYYAIYTSTIGSFMASLFNIRIFYVMAIILIFLIKPILIILKRDGWLTAMNISIIISLPLSPFGFNFDQILILPSIVQIIAWLSTNQLSKKITRIILGCLASFYLLVYWLLSINRLEYYWFFIVPIAFLPIYIISWKKRRENLKLSYGS